MEESVQKQAEGGGDGRDRILETAIVFFAEHGIQGASLRALGQAAGQRNTGAIHYHFGDRDALVTAVLARIVDALNESPSEAQVRALQLSPADAMSEPLLGIVQWTFVPTLTLPLRYEWGAAAIKLLARILLGEAPAAARIVDDMLADGAAEFVKQLRQHLADLPEMVLLERIEYAFVNVVFGMAAVPYLKINRRTDSPGWYGTAVNNLLAYVAAGLAAPAPRRLAG